MTIVIWVLAALVGACAWMLARLARRVEVLEAGRARVHRMAEAVTLLSETAEAGFAAVAQEIEKLQRGPARAVPASTLARRVARASTQGETVEDIARRETLSEGEVRLHLALSQPPRPDAVRKGNRRAAVRA